MKNKYNVFFLILIFNFVNAQTNRVTYIKGRYENAITKTKLNTKKEILNDPMLKEFSKQMENSILNGEFELIYNNNSSFYRKVPKIGIEDNKIQILFDKINDDVFYKNLELKEKIEQKNLEVQLNILKPFNEYKWIITTEYKMISGYKCFKATCEKKDFYHPYKKITQVFNITAWFTPEIASSFGPKGIDGLPGLILEASENGLSYIYATKIEFGCKKEFIFEKPKSNKTVTEAEYENILIENAKRIQDEMGN